MSAVNVEDLLSTIVDSTRCELDILADLERLAAAVEGHTHRVLMRARRAGVTWAQLHTVLDSRPIRVWSTSAPGQPAG